MSAPDPGQAAAHTLPSVAVVGGGLAGLAAAAILCERGFPVELFESRRRLGGRAGSYWHESGWDDVRGEWIDHCQHVGMACCTNLTDFFRRTGLGEFLRRYETLHFIGPTGQRFNFRASRCLPAPFHLGPAFLGLKYLSLRERLGIARTLWRLARESADDAPDRPTIGEWLRQQNQSPRTLQWFWEVVLVSALGESLERASLPAARKVFVDGFMAAREAYCIDVPTAPLHELYDQRVAAWLQSRGTKIHFGMPVAGIATQHDGGLELELADGVRRQFDQAILAVPWRAAERLLDRRLRQAIPQLNRVQEIHSSPITGVHLWFDRPVTDVPHAVLVGRLSQWVFRRDEPDEPKSAAMPNRHYYQVVISASNDLKNVTDDLVLRVAAELAAIWPQARQAELLGAKVVTEREAVFSVRPGFEQLRPPQATPVPGLVLAGDWTATGWPATMEGAVRSGYLAAEAVLAAAGQPESVLAPDLPRGRLVRWFFGK